MHRLAKCFAIVTTATVAIVGRATAQFCNYAIGPNYTAQENSHLNLVAALGDCAQEFALLDSADVKAFSVHVRTTASSTHSIVLTLASDPLGAAPIASVVAALPASTHAFYRFDLISPVTLGPGTYYVLLSSNTPVGDSWCTMDGAISGPSDPYSGGRFFQSGSPVGTADGLFACIPTSTTTYDCAPSTSAAAAVFQAGGPVTPNQTTNFAFVSGGTLNVCKDVRLATVELTDGSLDISTGPDVNGFSQFTVLGGQGDFTAYVFGGVPFPASHFSIAGGSGSIDWASGDMIGSIDLTVSCFGFVDMPATAYCTVHVDLGTGVATVIADGLGAEVPTVGAPTSYCTAGTSTSGCVPSIGATGTPSASASSGFVITVSNVEGQKQGIFFYGIDNSGYAPLPWGLSTSFLCVKVPIQRTGTQSSGGTSNACDGSLLTDWNAYIAAHPGALGQPFAAGDQVFAQAWFRDPPAPKTTNLSDALEFVLQP